MPECMLHFFPEKGLRSAYPFAGSCSWAQELKVKNKSLTQELNADQQALHGAQQRLTTAERHLTTALARASRTTQYQVDLEASSKIFDNILLNSTKCTI